MSQEVLIDNKKNDKPSYAQPLNEEEVSFDAVSSIFEEYFPISVSITLSICIIYHNKHLVYDLMPKKLNLPYHFMP